MPFYVYVLLCEDGRYYTGNTKDIDARFKAHMKGTGSFYFKLHTPKTIVYTEEFATRREAIKREREIKKLSHDEKEKLVAATEQKWGISRPKALPKQLQNT